MQRTCLILIFFFWLGMLSSTGQLQAQAPQSRTPKSQRNNKPVITISPETTHAIEPVEKDGFINYRAALDREMLKGIAPADNAAVDYLYALGPGTTDGQYRFHTKVCEVLGVKPLPRESPGWNDFADLYPDDDFPAESFEAAQSAPWVSTNKRWLAEWLKSNKQPLNHLQALTKKPAFALPLKPIGENFDDSEKVISQGVIIHYIHDHFRIREVIGMLRARAMLHLGEKRYQQATQDLLVLHHLGIGLLTKPNNTIRYLNGSRAIALALHSDRAIISDPLIPKWVLRDYREQLSKLPLNNQLPHLINYTERYQALENIQEHIRLQGEITPPDLAERVQDPRRAIIIRTLTLVNWNEVLRDFNKCYDQYLDLLINKDRSEWPSEIDRIRALHPEPDVNVLDERMAVIAKLVLLPATESLKREITEYKTSEMVRLHTPLILTLENAQRRTYMQHELSVLGLAMAEYRVDHNFYPDQLTDLSPHYLKTIPVDRYGSQPLIYRPQGNSFLLYSVGPNEVDDLGHPSGVVYSTPTGDVRSDDIVMQVPLPEN